MSGSTSSNPRERKKKHDEAPLDRVLRALSSPIRRRILRALVDESLSASKLSKMLDLGLGVVSYHLNQVLAKDCEVVELTGSIPRRGAIEKFYGLRFQALTEADRRGDGGPEGMRRMSIEECFIAAAAATDSDEFRVLEGSGWEWFLAEVDDEGWEEIRRAGIDFNRRVEAAVERSRKTAGDGPSDVVVVGVAAFPTVSSPPAS